MHNNNLCGGAAFGVTSGRRSARRCEEIVEPLDATDAGVSDLASLKLLQPLDPNAGPLCDLGAPPLAFVQKLAGPLKKVRGHGRMVGKILRRRQAVINYPTETYYRERSLAYSGMPKIPDDQPINVLAKNVERLKKELELSNARIAQKSGLPKDISKTISNIEGAKHSTGVKKISTVAEVFGVDVWQLFITGLPQEPIDRKNLAKLVLLFIELNPTNRSRLVADAEMLRLREEADESKIKDDTIRGPADRGDSKSPRRKIA